MFKHLLTLNALKSKLVWLGVAQIVYPAVDAYLHGTFTPEMIQPVITGVATILFRAVTTKPLSEK